MRKDKLYIEASIIDSYYNEIPENTTNSLSSNESFEISEKLNSMSYKLDCITNLDFDIDVNILSIIQNAEDIKVRKKNQLETLYFILTSFLIVSLFLLIGMLSSFKTLIYVVIFISTFMPFVLIPFAKIYRSKEET